jgi:hypothetical protein
VEVRRGEAMNDNPQAHVLAVISTTLIRRLRTQDIRRAFSELHFTEDAISILIDN